MRRRGYTATVSVKTTKTSGGMIVLTEAGQAVEGSVGGQKQVVT
jgi:hypothetical protein